jgi:hypothetical protein
VCSCTGIGAGSQAHREGGLTFAEFRSFTFVLQGIANAPTMSEQKISQIRETIRQAKAAENESHALSSFLRTQVHRLHPAIDLPKQDPHEVLVEFVTRYIEHVPEFLDALSALMNEAGIYEQGRCFLEIAEDFFIEPPELLAEHTGMRALIDEAYLAHRLVEEVNDRIVAMCGVPLTPMDLTFSNLVVHQLLGEDFANQLDLAVHYSIEALMPLNTFVKANGFRNYVRTHRSEDWHDTLRRWPCLAGDSAISFQLLERPCQANIH